MLFECYSSLMCYVPVTKSDYHSCLDGFVSYGESFFVFTPTASSKRPQDVRSGLHLVCTDLQCAQNVSTLSNVTPSIFGSVTVGICWLLITRFRCVLTSLVQIVKSLVVYKPVIYYRRKLFNFEQTVMCNHRQML